MAFDIYKRGQGYNTRLYSALGAFVIVAFGGFALYNKLQGTGIWVETLVPAAVCGAFGFLIYWISNKPKVADFLIAAEGEVKKVSWSSRQEIMASTVVVIIVVLSLAGWLLMWDFGFRLLMDAILRS
jgi:preprotein translocase subunit SecE